MMLRYFYPVCLLTRYLAIYYERSVERLSKDVFYCYFSKVYNTFPYFCVGYETQQSMTLSLSDITTSKHVLCGEHDKSNLSYLKARKSSNTLSILV